MLINVCWFCCRSCTDIPCCLIFTLYLVGMVVVGIIGKFRVTCDGSSACDAGSGGDGDDDDGR